MIAWCINLPQSVGWVILLNISHKADRDTPPNTGCWLADHSQVPFPKSEMAVPRDLTSYQNMSITQWHITSMHCWLKVIKRMIINLFKTKSFTEVIILETLHIVPDICSIAKLCNEKKNPTSNILAKSVQSSYLEKKCLYVIVYPFSFITVSNLKRFIHKNCGNSLFPLTHYQNLGDQILAKDSPLPTVLLRELNVGHQTWFHLIE